MSDDKAIPTLFDIVVPGFEHQNKHEESPEEEAFPQPDRGSILEEIEQHLEGVVRNSVDKAISHAILEATQSIEENIMKEVRKELPWIVEKALQDRE